jgi:hypothetical protein
MGIKACAGEFIFLIKNRFAEKFINNVNID